MLIAIGALDASRIKSAQSSMIIPASPDLAMHSQAIACVLDAAIVTFGHLRTAIEEY
ncbi:hypothetical protein AB0485_004019 [Vibrio parahaemolyticus]